MAGDVEFEKVSFPETSYTYNISLKGDSWSKYIDIRHTKYIESLQDTYSDFSSDLFDSSDNIDTYVRICVTEGSSDIEHELKGFLQKAAEKMTDKQVFCSIIFAIASAAGYFVYDSYTTHNADVQKEISKNEVEKERLKVFNNMHEQSIKGNVQISAIERPIRTLVGIMDNNDSVYIDNKQISISRDDVKRNLQTVKRSSSKIAYCDGDYQLQRIDFSLGEMILYITKDGIQIKAYTTMLDDKDDAKLSKMIEEKRKSEDLPFALPLQMNIEYTEKRIKFGTIVGIGSPRPDKDNKPLSNLLTN